MTANLLNSEILPYILCSSEYSVDNNPYDNIYVDITMRCDMECNYCYNPLRSKSDMDLGYFEEVCRRLPSPVNFRLLGGEPTMHPRFFDFIIIAKSYDHSVFFASNGLRYNNPKFMEKLKALDVAYIAGLSMDGGTTNDEFYKVMNNRYCLDKKLEAIANLNKYKIKRVALSAIIIRNFNEQVVGELIELSNKYPDTIKYIHFRSAAMTGRWVKTESYTQSELKRLMESYFPTDVVVQKKVLQEIHCQPGDDGNCCFRFRPNRKMQISLIEFASEKSQRCPKRGKLLPDNYIIQPFYENMVKVGGVLAKDFGDVAIIPA